MRAHTALGNCMGRKIITKQKNFHIDKLYLKFNANHEFNLELLGIQLSELEKKRVKHYERTLR